MRNLIIFMAGASLLLVACVTTSLPPIEDPLVTRGREIFFNETFNGNGRTCGTCHRAENNFTIDPDFIATLPADDPLFVAETNPDLRENFENPFLMRQVGLILENLDGFDDLAGRFVMRAVPHTLALRNSVDSPDGPRTGWSGDGAPGDGSLRSFATGAVIQHFTKRLDRVPGVDFRLPTEEELDALEAFQLSLGRQADLVLPLPLTGEVARRGQDLFNDRATGKCALCHFNAGANADPGIFGPNPGNRNFNTGVEAFGNPIATRTGEFVPPDDGFGRPTGDGTFNTPPVVEAADTGPFFHNNSVETIEEAVAFYNSDAFNDSPSGQVLDQATGSGIALDSEQVAAIGAFLRVINALENIRQSTEITRVAIAAVSARDRSRALLENAIEEAQDASGVLSGAGLNPETVAHLRSAVDLAQRAIAVYPNRAELARECIAELSLARSQLVETSD